MSRCILEDVFWLIMKRDSKGVSHGVNLIDKMFLHRYFLVSNDKVTPSVMHDVRYLAVRVFSFYHLIIIQRINVYQVEVGTD